MVDYSSHATRKSIGPKEHPAGAAVSTTSRMIHMAVGVSIWKVRMLLSIPRVTSDVLRRASDTVSSRYDGYVRYFGLSFRSLLTLKCSPEISAAANRKAETLENTTNRISWLIPREALRCHGHEGDEGTRTRGQGRAKGGRAEGNTERAGERVTSVKSRHRDVFLISCGKTTQVFPP